MQVSVMLQELHLIPPQKGIVWIAHVYIVPAYDQPHTSLKEMSLLWSVFWREMQNQLKYIVTFCQNAQGDYS